MTDIPEDLTTQTSTKKDDVTSKKKSKNLVKYLKYKKKKLEKSLTKKQRKEMKEKVKENKENISKRLSLSNAEKGAVAHQYLEAWTEQANWKFNKVLQTWIINNFHLKEYFTSDAFKLFRKYAKSIVGSAKGKLVERCDELLNDPKLPEIHKRARKLKKTLTIGDNEDEGKNKVDEE